MLLSVCMMIKNEEKYLEECLSALNDLRNKIQMEVIIVDTGSTDSSVSIAQKFTDRVYFHPWNNNFSEMRNITFSYAIGEWILILDGDEVLETTEEIEKFFLSGVYKHFNAASIIVKNLSDSNNRKSYSPLRSIRLCNNKNKDVRYKGVVHNQLIHKTPVVELKDSLLHFGYVKNDRELMEKKFNRTASLLHQELDLNPDDIYYNYQLAVSYAMYGKTSEGAPYIEKALKLARKEANFEKYRYVLLFMAKVGVALQQYERVFQIEEDLNLYCSEYLDSNYYLGLSYFKSDMPLKGAEYFEKYLELVAQGKKLKSLKDTTIVTYTIDEEFVARKILGILYLKELDYEKALFHLEIYDNNKNDGVLVNEIINCLFNLDRLEGINKLYLKYYDKSSKLKTEMERIIEKLSNKLNNSKMHEAFIDGETHYNILNKIRLNSINYEDVLIAIDYIDFENSGVHFADILFEYIEDEIFYCKLKRINGSKQKDYIEYMQNKYPMYGSKISKLVIKKIDFLEKNTHDEIRFILNLIEPIISKQLISGDAFVQLIEIYLNLGVMKLANKYTHEYILNQELKEFLQEEYFFKMYYMAKEILIIDKKTFVSQIRNLIQYSPSVEVINYILSRVEETRNLQNIESELQQCIQKNDIDKIDSLLIELNNYDMYTEKIYTLLSMIYLQNGQLERANRVLIDGLNYYEKSHIIFEYLKLLYGYQKNNKMEEIAEYLHILYKNPILASKFQLKASVSDFIENCKFHFINPTECFIKIAITEERLLN